METTELIEFLNNQEDDIFYFSITELTKIFNIEKDQIKQIKIPGWKVDFKKSSPTIIIIRRVNGKK